MEFPNKAEWHQKVNKGEIPLLELPSGKLIPGVEMILDLAKIMGGDRGLDLRPIA
jgi:hypothetical protein